MCPSNDCKPKGVKIISKGFFKKGGILKTKEKNGLEFENIRKRTIELQENIEFVANQEV